jgi:FAD binding domain-containing protein
LKLVNIRLLCDECRGWHDRRLTLRKESRAQPSRDEFHDPESRNVLLHRGGRPAGMMLGFLLARAGIEFVVLEKHADFLRYFRGDIIHVSTDDCDKIKLLTVMVDRLVRWHRPGLLCIGDASHAMLPIGGIGINLAIQHAVPTANLLIARLRRRELSEAHLRALQRRREISDPCHSTSAAVYTGPRRLHGASW